MGRCSNSRFVKQIIIYYFKKKRVFIAIAMVSAIIIAFISGIQILLSRIIIDSFQKEELVIIIAYFSIGYLIIPIVRDILSYFITVISVSLATKISTQIRKDITLSMATYRRYENESEKESVGKTLSILMSDVEVLENYIMSNVTSWIKSLFSLVSASTVLYIISPLVSLVVVFTLPLQVLKPHIISKKMKPMWTKMRSLRDRLTDVVTELYNNQINLQIYSLRSYAKKRIVSGSEAYALGFYKLVKKNSKLKILGNIMSQIPLIIVLGIIFFHNNNMSVGSLIASINAYFNLLYPITTLSNVYSQTVKTKISVDRINSLFRTSNIFTNEIKNNIKGIVVKNMSLKFQERIVLKNINFYIPLGLIVVISGKSGEGKTSLLKVLAGIMAPNSGSVLINGIQPTRLDSYERPYKIAYQSQKTVLFNDSLRRNVDPNDEHTDSEINKILNNLNLGHLCLDTQICTNKSDMLSEGEKTRVLLARLILRDADINFLDEPFASLDDATAKKVWNCLTTDRNKTILIVTHKVLSWMHFDKKFIIQNGILKSLTNERIIK